jgi:polyisoprenoid-binding protein YceI
VQRFITFRFRREGPQSASPANTSLVPWYRAAKKGFGLASATGEWMMSKRAGLYGPLSILLCGLLVCPAAFAADRYTVDSEQSFIRVATKMCEPDLLKGEFGHVTGEILLDEDKLEKSSVTLTVTVADAVFDHDLHRTDNIRDIIMGKKILKAAEYPVISFKSTEITPTNTQQFSAYGQTSSVITARVKGELTLVGETHPIELEVTFHDKTGMTGKGRMVAAFSAFGTFERSAFGVVYGLDRVGIRRMGDEVMVMASVTANRSE